MPCSVHPHAMDTSAIIGTLRGVLQMHRHSNVQARGTSKHQNEYYSVSTLTCHNILQDMKQHNHGEFCVSPQKSVWFSGGPRFPAANARRF